jgi:hypothetical protein
MCRCLWLGRVQHVGARSCWRCTCAVWHLAGSVSSTVCVLCVQCIGWRQPPTSKKSSLRCATYMLALAGLSAATQLQHAVQLWCFCTDTVLIACNGTPGLYQWSCKLKATRTHKQQAHQQRAPKTSQAICSCNTEPVWRRLQTHSIQVTWFQQEALTYKSSNGPRKPQHQHQKYSTAHVPAVTV